MKKIIITSLLFLFLRNSGIAQQNPDQNKLIEVFNYINYLYVDNVNTKEITESAIVAALEKLDPHSTYISKEDVDDANQSINGNFVGVGIRFQLLKDTRLKASR